jgi:hypothetical protein
VRQLFSEFFVLDQPGQSRFARLRKPSRFSASIRKTARVSGEFALPFEGRASGMVFAQLIAGVIERSSRRL